MNNSNTPLCIAGAGVAGLCIAYRLANRGHAVHLYDPHPVETRRNASLMAGGMLAPYSEIEFMPPAFIPAALQGLEFWRIALEDTSDFSQNGTLIIAHKNDAHLFSRLTQKLKHFSVSKILNTDQITTLEPDLKNFGDALYIAEEAHVNTAHALQILQEKITCFIPQKFDFGQMPAGQWTIDCRGYDAINEDKNLRGVKGEALLVRNREFSLKRPVRLLHPRYPLYIVPRPDHVFMIGATLIESADERKNSGKVSVKSALELLSAAYSLHPSFADSEIIKIYAGIRPAYTDNLPRITVQDTIIRCNGLFRHGFLLAPIMADCIADMIEGRENKFLPLFMKESHA